MSHRQFLLSLLCVIYSSHCIHPCSIYAKVIYSLCVSFAIDSMALPYNQPISASIPWIYPPSPLSVTSRADSGAHKKQSAVVCVMRVCVSILVFSACRLCVLLYAHIQPYSTVRVSNGVCVSARSRVRSLPSSAPGCRARVFDCSWRVLVRVFVCMCLCTCRIL